MKFRLRILLIFFVCLGSFIAYYSVWVVGELQPNYLDIVEDDINDLGLSYANLISQESNEDKVNVTSLKIAFDNLHQKKNRNKYIRRYEKESRPIYLRY